CFREPDRSRAEVAADLDLPGMRHVLRRAPGTFPARSPATPSQGNGTGFLLQLLPATYQPRGQVGTQFPAREPYRQRNQLLSQQATAGAFSEDGAGGFAPS